MLDAASRRFTLPKALVAPAAILVVSDSAVVRSSSAGTTWLTIPQSRAWAALSRRLVRASSAVRRMPISRGRNQVAPPSGERPTAV